MREINTLYEVPLFTQRVTFNKDFQVATTPHVRTIGFEFDIHFGTFDFYNTALTITTPLSIHTKRNDGFVLKPDGPRIELATKKIDVSSTGLTDLQNTIKNINAFSKELSQECSKAKLVTMSIPNYSNYSGKSRPFNYSKMVSTNTFKIYRLPVNERFSDKCSVWASPQATIAIPLNKIASLISIIKSSEGKKSPFALSGTGNARMGVKSDALYYAKKEVEIYKQVLIKKKLKLSNGKDIDALIFSDNFTGFLILFVSYLRTSKLKYEYNKKGGDYERFAKAYLPINVKAPFCEIYTQLLTPDEQLLFREHFANGANRINLFNLVVKKATLSAGNEKLFPTGPKVNGLDSVHEWQKSEFHTIPTWDDFIEHTLNSSHNGWGVRLMVPISKQILLANTSPNVALELRRVGFRPMFDNDWGGFMEHIFKIIDKI